MAKQLIHSEENFIIPSTGLKEYIAGLASRYGVSYVKTRADEWAETVTRLSGDDVVTDEVEDMIVALKRNHVVDAKTMVILLGNYLDEKKHV